jgi:hypothetical protein
MKFKLLLLFFLFVGVAHAGDTINDVNYGFGHHTVPAIFVNGESVQMNSNGFWLGNVFIKSSETEAYDNSLPSYTYWLSCIIYIQPGTSVSVIDSPGELNQTFNSLDTVFENEWGNGPGLITINCQFTIIIQYLSDTATAILNIQPDKQLTIYPNPTTRFLNFTNYYSINGTGRIDIFDITGVEVLQQNFEVGFGIQTNPIDISNLPNGVYLLQYTVNGNRRIERIVKI